jgi:Glycosyltransferase family 87
VKILSLIAGSRRPAWPYRLGLVLSLTYCLAAGVLGLGLPGGNGIDLSVCYVAGVTSLRGSSPYNHSDLTRTRSSLNASLASKPSLPFAYPPSVIPVCVLMSLLPWQIAQALWKLLNIGFLIGAVLLTFRLFSTLYFSLEQRYLLWSFAFVFSPTVSVLLVGQSSLFVLFTLVATMVLADLKQEGRAGVGLALALTKPHLSFALALLLLLRGRWRLVICGLLIFTVLGILGLQLSHSSIEMFLRGVRRYASLNRPTDPRLVGIQSLATLVGRQSRSVTTLLSAIAGLLLLGITLWLDRQLSSRGRSQEVLPLLLVVSVFSFGAHSYDLVFLIPACIWAMARWRRDKGYLLVVLLCFTLVLPLNLVTMAYEKSLSHLAPSGTFQLMIEPYRSWILLILVLMVGRLTYARSAGTV